MNRINQKKEEVNFYLLYFNLEGGSCEGCPLLYYITKNKDICFLEKNYKFVPRVYYG